MNPINPKVVKFFTNISIWSICCALILGYNSISNKTGIINKISSEDKAALAELIDLKLAGALIASCFIIFFIAAFIGFRWGAPNSQARMNALYNQIISELCSVLLNVGSVCFAVGYFSGTFSYYFSAAFFYAIWFFVEPRQTLS